MFRVGEKAAYIKFFLILFCKIYLFKSFHVSTVLSSQCQGSWVSSWPWTQWSALRTPGIVRMVLFLHKMQLPQVHCHYWPLDSSLALLTISLKSSIMFFLVYKERERMFFSEISRTEWLFVTCGTLLLSFISLHCKRIPLVSYYLINCRLHCVGFIASNTQMGFQYPSYGLQRTELSTLGIVYS